MRSDSQRMPPWPTHAWGKVWVCFGDRLDLPIYNCESAETFSSAGLVLSFEKRESLHGDVRQPMGIASERDEEGIHYVVGDEGIHSAK